MRVLVIDDDADIAQMLVRIVAKLGHDAEACTDPLEAIEYHSLRFFDVVISDYMMNPNGVEVLRAFEGQDCMRVLLTASYTNSEMSRALLSGAVHLVLTKPAILADLRSVFRHAETSLPARSR